MAEISFKELNNGLSFKGDLQIGDKFIVLPKSAPVTDELLSELEEWTFETFSYDGSAPIQIEKTETKTESAAPAPQQQRTDAIKKAIAYTKTAGIANSDKARLDVTQRVFNEYMNYINYLFTTYVTHDTIDQNDLTEHIKDLIVFIRENKRFILRISPNAAARTKNYLVVHSMRTTVIAIVIALQLHMPLSKLIELGVACVLHEIGMIRLPPQLYLNERQLNPTERAQMMKHTLLGYNIINKMGFPTTIQLGILEHHEKENGTGYPRKLTGDKISQYAKIILVACTYEAITAPRTYKEEVPTFKAILEMMKNPDHQFDDNVLKALVYSVSLFPIGTYVLLKNGKLALVTDTNPDNPKLPVVQLLLEWESDGEPKTVQTDAGENAIARVLTENEIEAAKKKSEELEPKVAPKIQPKTPAEPKEESSIPKIIPTTKKPAEPNTEDVDISHFM